MAFLKSLINKIFLSDDSDGDDAVDHYAQLERLRLNHDWLQVKVTKSGRSYQSLVIQVDAEHHELLIDDLYPPEELDSLEAGDTLEIHSQTKRNPVNFFTRILAREVNGNEASWRLELPEEIGSNHSRGAYRMYVETELGLEIELYSDEGPLSHARIINLSTEGLKLSFSEQEGEYLEKNQLFENSIIRLPDGEDIDCDIQMSNVYRIRTPNPHTLGGGKLIISNPQQRVKLQQYIASVQRQQRRREMRTL